MGVRVSVGVQVAVKVGVSVWVAVGVGVKVDSGLATLVGDEEISTWAASTAQPLLEAINPNKMKASEIDRER